MFAPCRLPGGIGTKQLRCTWHSYAGGRPALAEDREEFERWVDSLREQGICSVWTHHRPDALWHALRGAADLPLDARACQQTGCPHATGERFGPPLNAPEALRQIRAKLAQMGRGLR